MGQHLPCFLVPGFLANNDSILVDAGDHPAGSCSGGACAHNISLSGVQVRLNKQRVLKIGDRVIIAFHLDDDAKTEIREMMVVRNVIGFFAGLAFNAQPNTNAYETYINQKSE